VLVGDAEDASLVTLNVPKRSVAFYFSPDFGTPLTLFTRRTTVYLRDQHVRDQILADDRPWCLKRRTSLIRRIDNLSAGIGLPHRLMRNP
jgi:hypothetical protein